jgi:hypothetical protein
MDSAFIAKAVDDQIKLWPRITKTDLVTCLSNYMWLYFRIEGNTLRLLSHQNEFKNRNEQTAGLIREVLKRHTVKDCDFVITIDEITFTPNSPLFIVGKAKGSKNFLIPDFTFFDYSEVNMGCWKEWREKMLLLNLTSKDYPKIFFAGDSHTARDKYLKLNDSRFKFWHTKMQTNETQRIKLPDGTEQSISATNNHFLPYEYIAKYKYLLHLEGRNNQAHSGRLKYILACNSVVFSEPLVHREFWYDLMKPDVNYIEFDGTIEDMLNRFDLIEADPTAYDRIQNAGRRVVEELTYEDVLKYYALLLNKYADLF